MPLRLEIKKKLQVRCVLLERGVRGGRAGGGGSVALKPRGGGGSVALNPFNPRALSVHATAITPPLPTPAPTPLQARSDRVKCVDVHPVEPWVLSALYNGKALIWDYESGSMVKVRARIQHVNGSASRPGSLSARNQHLNSTQPLG